ncbi:unnamed protein product [Ectocarpus sp. CCAP 1310/34]|nr:unnamed protein product [Ectocarpus sp. CCAP 1310/34]
MTPAAPRVGDTQNQAWKNDKSKFGLKMMQKMGWTEGKGLGKNEDGVSEHVKVAKKSNNLGLGATRDSSGAAGWASAAVSFNGVLETLGKAYGGGADVGGKAKMKGDKRTKKKLKKAEKKKKKQTAKDDEDAAESSSSSSSEGGPAMTAAQAASSCPSRARRVRSKDVKGFSAAELRAILGQAATTADPSLPSYPVVRGGCGTEGAAAAATEPKISKKKSSNKKSKGSKSTSLDAPPRRPRTRSMDETAPPAEPPAVVGGKRPRDQPVDHAREGEETEGEAAASSTTTSAPRKSKKKKAGRAGEGNGEGCETAPVAGSSSKEKERAKKSKKRKGQ